MRIQKVSLAVCIFAVIVGLCSCSFNGNNSITESETIVEKEATKIFYIDLYDNIYDYNDQYIETILPIDKSYSDDEIRAEQYVEYCINAEFKRELTETERASSFVKVKGTVAAEADGNVWDKYNIIDADAIEFYTSIPEDFSKDLAEYEEKLKADKIAEREEFIASCEEPDYETLLRYPDTCKDKSIKLTVTVTRVDSDGILFQGAIWATYNGQEIIISDDRLVREPRIIEGDVIVIYAKGNGLTTIKTYEEGTGILGSNLGADVVDEHDVPYISMIYTELDNIEAFGNIE